MTKSQIEQVVIANIRSYQEIPSDQPITRESQVWIPGWDPDSLDEIQIIAHIEGDLGITLPWLETFPATVGEICDLFEALAQEKRLVSDKPLKP